MKRGIALTFLLMLIFSSQSPTVTLLDGEGEYYSDISDPPIIGFNDFNGIFVDENSTLSGFIVSSVLPDSTEWYVSELLISGELSAITQPLELTVEEIFSSQDDGLSRWSWEISNFMDGFVNGTGGANVCACYLTVMVTSGIHQSSRSLAFFVGDSDSPGITLDNEEDRLSTELDVSGWASSPSGEPVPASISISNELSSTGRCSSQPDRSLLNTNTNTSITEYLSLDGYFSASIDISSLVDGWYSLWYSLNSTSVDEPSINYCTKALVDNSNPVASIEGPESSQEGDGDLIFDAGDSYDPFWGKDSLSYIWSLIKTGPAGNYIVDSSEGTDSSFFVVEDSTSGEYILSLIVVDGQGMIDQNVHEFSIANQPPLAKLSISGESFSDGDKVQLSDLPEWNLDATQSLDTSNDVEGLRCVWKINYKTIYEGCERTLLWPEGNNNDTILLTLDVIDDDEEYSSITVELSRVNTESSIQLPIIVLMLSTLFFISSLIYSRRRNDDMEIPKWNES